MRSGARSAIIAVLVGLGLCGCQEEPDDPNTVIWTPEEVPVELRPLMLEPIEWFESAEVLPEGPICTLYDDGMRLMVVSAPVGPPHTSTGAIKVRGQVVTLRLDSTAALDRFDEGGVLYQAETVEARISREPGPGERVAGGRSHPGRALMMPPDGSTSVAFGSEWKCGS